MPAAGVGERAPLLWRCSRACRRPAARRSRTRRRRAGWRRRWCARAIPGMPETLKRRAVRTGRRRSAARSGDAKLTQEEAAEVVRLARASHQVSGLRQARRRLESRREARPRRRRASASCGARSKAQGKRRALPELPRARPRRDQRRQHRAEPDRLRRAARQLGGGREAHLREDLQRVGLLPVLQHAAPRRERPSHARADRRTSSPISSIRSLR